MNTPDEQHILSAYRYIQKLNPRAILSAQGAAEKLAALGFEVSEEIDQDEGRHYMIVEGREAIPTFTNEEQARLIEAEGRPGGWVERSPEFLVEALDLARALFAWCSPGMSDPTTSLRGRGFQMDAIRDSFERLIQCRRWNASLRTYTPGPWKVSLPHVTTGEGVRVAEIVQSCLFEREDQPGNARLIAEAPEMYRLIKAIAHEPRAHSLEIRRAAQALVDQLALEATGATYSEGPWRVGGASVVADFAKGLDQGVADVAMMLFVERDDQPGNARLIAAAPAMYGIINRCRAGRITERLKRDAVEDT